MSLNEKAALDGKIEAAQKSTASTQNYTPRLPWRNALLRALDVTVRSARESGREVPPALLRLWERHHG